MSVQSGGPGVGGCRGWAGESAVSAQGVSGVSQSVLLCSELQVGCLGRKMLAASKCV